jgi:predicted permease
MAALRVFLRPLINAPLFTIVAVLSLALGIGANTAIFSITDQMLIRPLPVVHPEELVFLYSPGSVQGHYTADESGGPSFSYPLFRELRKQQTPFQDVAGMHLVSASLSYQNAPAVVLAELVSGNYYSLLGVSPALGRLINEDDDRTLSEHPVVVLSHDYWVSRFGSNPSILNQKVLINSTPMTVIGVSKAGFRGDRLDDYPQVFVPMAMKREMTPGRDGMDDRKDYWVKMMARLKPGMTLERATTEINATYAAQVAQDVDLLRSPGPRFLEEFKARKIVLRPGEGGRGDTRRQAKEPLQILLGITIFVLLLACANVANLQLARGAARMRDVAVRLALGASRNRVVRSLVAESCTLALLGGAVGLLLAKPTLLLVIADLPAGSRSLISTELDVRVLLFALGISLLTGVLFGLYPAIQAAKPDVAATLKDEAGRASTGVAYRLRSALAIAQIAISFLLLISAGLFARSLLNLSTINLGFRTDHLLTFSISPKLNGYDDAHAAAVHEQLLTRLAGLAGVASASAADIPAIADSDHDEGIVVEGFTAADGPTVTANTASIAPDYFRTMEIPLVAGREFSAADGRNAPKVAIVNQAFVRKFIAGREPLGRHLKVGDENAQPLEIVGVVRDTKYSNVRDAPPPVFYTAQRQNEKQDALFFYVRTRTMPEAGAASVRREVAAVDPNLPIRELHTMEAQVRENIFEDRIMSQLTALFAGLATVLAGAGIYGVLAYNVTRRTREIGIRMALGATTGRVRTMVLREGLWLFGIGAAAGLVTAWGVTRLIASFLFGLQPWDPAVYVAVSLALGALSLLAAYLPARGASIVDPITALRHE